MTHTPQLRRLDVMIAILVWSAVIVAGGYHLGLQLAAVKLPGPMGAWETVYASIARAWPQQYQWSHYIDGHDGYGPGYPLFVRPFLAAGLEVYVAHRIANVVAIALACALVARLVWRQGASWRVTAAVTAIIYALNAGSYSIQARPDFLLLAETTAMLAWGAAVARRQATMGLGFAFGFGLLAVATFLTKAYGTFTWAAVLTYLLVFVDRKGAFRAALVGAIMLASAIGAYAYFNPLYWMEVFHGQSVQVAPSLAWLRHQLLDFALLAGGLIAIPVARSIAAARREANTTAAAPRDWYWESQTLLGGAMLLIGPAWHTGAYLTYFLHILLVPLAGLAAKAIAQAKPVLVLWLEALLVANLALLMWTAPGWPRHDAAWAELRKDILEERGKVAVDYLMEPIVRERPGTIIVSTGATGYNLKEPFLISRTSPTVLRARAAAHDYLENQERELFGPDPARTIYLDCNVVRGEKNRSAIIPRNEIPHFTGPAMNGYVPVKSFDICPFYFATNAPRQEAGAITTTIVKFVRKP